MMPDAAIWPSGVSVMPLIQIEPVEELNNFRVTPNEGVTSKSNDSYGELIIFVEIAEMSRLPLDFLMHFPRVSV